MSAGIVPTRSIDLSLVYGSSGASRFGALAATGSGALGTGLLVRSATRPSTVEPTALAIRPRPPFARTRTPTPRAITATPRSRRNGKASPGPRSTRRWAATRDATVGRGLSFAGIGRPVEGGRGRTCGGRPPRRVVIGSDCRTRGTLGAEG